MHHSLLSLLLVLTALVGLPACNVDRENDVHRLNLVAQRNNSVHLYADQTTDTLTVQSTDSWRLELTFRHLRDTARLHLSTTALQLPEGNTQLHTTPVVLRFATNTTDSTLTGILKLRSAFPLLKDYELYFYQYTHLHIDYPRAEYDNKFNRAYFAHTLTHNDRDALLRFTLYDKDSTTHSLTSDATWLRVPAKHARPAAGRHTVHLEVDRNTTVAPRKAHVTLTSGGISTVITYTQLGTLPEGRKE